MEFLLYIAAGALVGLAVGVTGVGGGSLMTPLLLLFGFPPHVAIGTDLLIASQAHISDLLFWGALIFSLSVGFVAAFPINATLVYFGVKEGMKNPAEMGQNQPSGQAQAAD